jgi:hypothetical protein
MFQRTKKYPIIDELRSLSFVFCLQSFCICFVFLCLCVLSFVFCMMMCFTFCLYLCLLVSLSHVFLSLSLSLSLLLYYLLYDVFYLLSFSLSVLSLPLPLSLSMSLSLLLLFVLSFCLYRDRIVCLFVCRSIFSNCEELLEVHQNLLYDLTLGPLFCVTDSEWSLRSLSCFVGIPYWSLISFYSLVLYSFVLMGPLFLFLNTCFLLVLKADESNNSRPSTPTSGGNPNTNPISSPNPNLTLTLTVS